MGETNPISGAAHRPIYYVIPEAAPEMVDIDGDGTPDLSHEKIGIIYFLNQCPAAIRTRKIEDKPKVAISISGVKIPITDIQKTGVPIDNAHKAQLATIFAGRSYEKNNIEIEKLHKLNIPIFISAGNKTKAAIENKTDVVNYESFLPGTISVGALEPNLFKNMQLETAKYSSNTDLVTQWEQGTYDIRVIRETKGPQQGEIIGFNITNGDKVDIPIAETSSKGKNLKTIKMRFGNSSEYIEILANKKLRGTSNAAPVAGGKAAVTMFGKKACGLTE